MDAWKELTDTLASLREDLDNALRERDALREERDALFEERDALREERDAALKQLAARAANAAAPEQLAVAPEQIGELQESINTLKAELEALTDAHTALQRCNMCTRSLPFRAPRTSHYRQFATCASCERLTAAFKPKCVGAARFFLRHNGKSPPETIAEFDNLSNRDEYREWIHRAKLWVGDRTVGRG